MIILVAVISLLWLLDRYFNKIKTTSPSVNIRQTKLNISYSSEEQSETSLIPVVIKYIQDGYTWINSKINKEYLQTSDKSVVSLEWLVTIHPVEQNNNNSSNAILIIWHDDESMSNVCYQHMCLQASSNGFKPVIVRKSSFHVESHQSSFHKNLSLAKEVLMYIEAKCPFRSIVTMTTSVEFCFHTNHLALTDKRIALSAYVSRDISKKGQLLNHISNKKKENDFSIHSMLMKSVMIPNLMVMERSELDEINQSQFKRTSSLFNFIVTDFKTKKSFASSLPYLWILYKNMFSLLSKGLEQTMSRHIKSFRSRSLTT